MAALLHDFNAARDKKFLKLRSRLGWEGYGLFWAIWEFLGEVDGHSFSMDEAGEVALSLSTGCEKVVETIEACLEIGILKNREGQVYCPGQLKRLQVFEDRREKWRDKKRRQRADKKGDVKKSPRRQPREVPKSSKGDKDNPNPKDNPNTNRSKKKGEGEYQPGKSITDDQLKDCLLDTNLAAGDAEWFKRQLSAMIEHFEGQSRANWNMTLRSWLRRSRYEYGDGPKENSGGGFDLHMALAENLKEST